MPYSEGLDGHAERDYGCSRKWSYTYELEKGWVGMERRRCQRIQFELPVSYHGPKVLGTARVTMLSHAGCTLTNIRTVEVPSYLDLTIALPDHTVLVKTGAAVRWRENGTLGAEFLFMTRADQQALAWFLGFNSLVTAGERQGD
jgi:PilZ domain